MSPEFPELSPGQKVWHPELGEGVVISANAEYANVFFRAHGEKRTLANSLQLALDEYDQIAATPFAAIKERTNIAELLWLAIEAEELPLLENAAELTSSKVDLLPHQIVLVHRIAAYSPRRFLIADEVGLGKTIETALILRELASRGELNRAIMIVPAGLVENWRHELNDVFNLDFEVFGSEGDVTDRKTNAFEKHDRLIASVDTLKRPARIKKLLAAPAWDLVVFDEAHHLSVYKTGKKKVSKTENLKLAEAIKDHCHDLLLLSATPHQGDHFRFWALIHLLNPELFEDEHDMLLNRHRLNAVVIRRTKADACSQDGGPLFARRMVHTRAFSLSEPEKQFYNAIIDYLRDGYDLAAKEGRQGRALGFVMSVFQKIAASSFAAIRSTLIRRLLMLTIQEGIEQDELLNVDLRDQLYAEAKELVRSIHKLENDAIGNAQAEQLFADAKYQLLKKRKEAMDFAASAESQNDSEWSARDNAESATMLVTLALPEERSRIRELLRLFPAAAESKIILLSEAIQEIWQENPEEKIVIFATYLSTVEIIRKQLDRIFPGIGIEVLKGGDHGSKTAAQKRFKNPSGPKVLVCTAAGREGINLQFARILFNYDLPWNPMDLEQRIGRIHRYGQNSTSQVYNLVSTDTIEGKIFMLLEEKLHEIAAALGKVNERGEIAEDLRGQILGQLGGVMNFSKIYQDGVNDPTLERTKQELEVALSNACQAREVVFELFQDLDRFNLGDYQQIGNMEQGMCRLLNFVAIAARNTGGSFQEYGQEDCYKLQISPEQDVIFTIDRELAVKNDNLQLLGLDHPSIHSLMAISTNMINKCRFIGGKLTGNETGLLTIWKIETRGNNEKKATYIVRLAIDENGQRNSSLENMHDELLNITTDKTIFDYWKDVLIKYKQNIYDMLHRELQYSGIVNNELSYSMRPVAFIGITGNL